MMQFSILFHSKVAMLLAVYTIYQAWKRPTLLDQTIVEYATPLYATLQFLE